MNQIKIFQKRMTLKKFIILNFLLINILNFKINAADLLITTSGTYLISDDILSSGDATNGSIRIQSSYVTLDLGGCFIQQITNTANCNGIQIDPGVTNVTVKNGTLLGFTKTGIVAGAGCSVLTLQDLKIESCAIRGIDFSGTATATGGAYITESEISRVKILNCLSSASSDYGINLTNCQNVTVQDCIFNNNNSNNPSGCQMIGLTDSNYCSIKNVDINGNSGLILYGIGLQGSVLGSSSNIISGCTIRNNSTSATFVPYFLLGNLTNNNIIENSQILQNTSTSAFVPWEFALSGYNTMRNVIFKGNVCQIFDTAMSSSNGNLFYDISFINNSSPSPTGGFGIIIAGNNNYCSRFVINNNSSTDGLDALLVQGSTNSVFEDFTISGNSSPGGSFYGVNLEVSNNCIFSNFKINGNSGANMFGFQIFNSTKNVIKDSTITSNISTGGGNAAYGLQIADSGSIGNMISNCLITENNATTDALSYGINTANTNNIFTRNISYKNGPTNPIVGNQLFGLPLTSQSTPGRGGAGSSSGRMTTMRNAWSNLRITG